MPCLSVASSLRRLARRVLVLVAAGVLLAGAPRARGQQAPGDPAVPSPVQRARLAALAQAQAAEAAAARARVAAFAERTGAALRRVHPGTGAAAYLTDVQGARLFVLAPANATAAAASGVDRLYDGGDLGLALTGAGVPLGLWDGGALRASHVELASRVTQVDTPQGLTGHGTHVAGTLIAAGVRPEARGMAPGATLQAHDFLDDDLEMIALAPTLSASNHSYGFLTGWTFNFRGDDRWVWFGAPSVDAREDYGFGFYLPQTRVWDVIARNAPGYLIVKAAGNDRADDAPPAGTEHWIFENGAWALATDTRADDCAPDGYDCLLPVGTAKNILTVGGVDDLPPGGYTAPADVAMSAFSAWGPTDDGRIKPDLVTKSVGLLSSFSSSDVSYTTGGGTSRAAPVATGAVALLQEHYAATHGGARMSAALAKALLLHTTHEAGPADGPDYRFGWGLLNAGRAAALVGTDALTGAALHELTLQPGQTLTLPVASDGATPLRATIAWTDVPGTPPALAVDPTTPLLVNDLDLRLVGPGGQTHRPWILDPAQPDAPATTGDNVRDNVEQVVVAAPAPGTYTLRLTHKGTLQDGAQPVALVVGAPGAARVEGAVAEAGRGDPLGALALTLAGPGGSRTVPTDAAGAFAFASVPDGTYTLTPDAPGYAFTPASRTVTVQGGDVTGADFTAEVPVLLAPAAYLRHLPTTTGGATTDAAVTLQNGGAAATDLTFAVEAPTAPAFVQAVTPAAGTVPGGTAADVTARLATDRPAPAFYEDVLTLTTNDPATPQRAVPVAAYLTAPADAPAEEAVFAVEADGRSVDAALGVELVAPDVTGAGLVGVWRHADGPTGTDGIAEASVSAYRWTVFTTSGLTLGAAAEVRFRLGRAPGIGAPDAVQVYRRATPGTGPFAPVPTVFDDGGDADPANDALVAVGLAAPRGEFVLASSDPANPLPVELTRLTATLGDDDAPVLTWTTASETRNAGFDVQRRFLAGDGDAGDADTGAPAARPATPGAWQTLGFVAGAGTTTDPQRYRFVDRGLPFEAAGAAYRLRQVDFDGTATASGAVEVRVGRPEAVALHAPFPHPVHGRATLRLALPTAQAVDLAVYDVLGRRVATLATGPHPAGRHELPLDARALASGVYVVRLRADAGTVTRRLVVVR